MTYGRAHPVHFVDRVRELTKEGLSARQIAIEMGTTRNVIIGIWSRHGIKSIRKQETAPVANYRPKSVRWPHPSRRPAADISTLSEDGCRYPLDDGTFCNAERASQSYCDAHACLCYVHWKMAQYDALPRALRDREKYRS